MFEFIKKYGFLIKVYGIILLVLNLVLIGMYFRFKKTLKIQKKINNEKPQEPKTIHENSNKQNITIKIEEI
jgi:hypothetical protein